MLLLDVIVRYPTATILLVIAALAMRDGKGSLQSKLGGLTALTVAALLLGTPQPVFTLPSPLHELIRFIDVPSVVLVWFFGRSLFEDEFGFGAIEKFILISFLIAVSYFRCFELGYTDYMVPYLPLVVSMASSGLMLHLIFIIVRDRDDDMVEDRRTMRLYFSIGLIITSLVTVIGERVFFDLGPEKLNLLRALMICPIAIFALHWMVHLRPEQLEFERKIETVVAPKPKIDPRDVQLYQRLNELMLESKVYKEPGITIRALAERLQSQEHRVRALINQGLGFRNFSRFLNEYRIKAVIEAMQVPDNSRTPILTLALDEGFNSLAPFNRAFKQIVGQTPTEFRAQLQQKLIDSQNS